MEPSLLQGSHHDPQYRIKVPARHSHGPPKHSLSTQPTCHYRSRSVFPVRLHVLGGRDGACWFISKSLAAPQGPARSSLWKNAFHLFHQYPTLVSLQTLLVWVILAFAKVPYVKKKKITKQNPAHLKGSINTCWLKVPKKEHPMASPSFKTHALHSRRCPRPW